MPPKKIVTVVDPAADLQTGQVVELSPEVAAGLDVCGHVNKQSFNIDGQLEDVACALAAGHVGDPSANIQVLRENPYTPKDPAATYKWVAGKEYEIKTDTIFWGTAAGVPTALIQPDYGGMTREQWVHERRKQREEEIAK